MPQLASTVHPSNSATLNRPHCDYCTETLRIIASAFIFTGGLALLHDNSTPTAVLAQTIILLLEVAKSTQRNLLHYIQAIFVQGILLVILVSDYQRKQAVPRTVNTIVAREEREEAFFENEMRRENAGDKIASRKKGK